MNEPDVICNNCGWEGNTSQLDGVKCPECGVAKSIEDYIPSDEPLWKHFYDFNWNKI